MSESKNDQQIEDKTRIEIAIGLIAIYSAIFYLVQKYASYEGDGLNIFLAYVLYGFYVFSVACLFMYIILSGLHYKYKNENYAGDFYFPERLRKFSYDYGVEIIVLGFLYSTIFTINKVFQTYFNLSNKALEILIWALAVLIVVTFHHFFIDTEKKSK